MVDDNLGQRRAAEAAATGTDAVAETADEGDSEALLALRSAQLGYQAAADATGRVRLPSLSDFIG